MEEANALDVDRLCAIIESMLLVSSEPLAIERIREIVLAEEPSADPALVDQAVAALGERYADPARIVGRGFRLDQVADGLQLRTPAESAPFLRRLLAARPPKLTKPAMETLAVIAYRQPVTKPEIESIRGVDVGAVLKALLDRDLIRIIGKSDDLGRPILYGTTKKFLELFGLRSLGALPTLREYHELDEVHQQHVDELYESEPKISDLAAKAAFLIERKHDADLDALASAEASVEAAGKRTEAVLSGEASGEAAAPERPTDAPPPGSGGTEGAPGEVSETAAPRTRARGKRGAATATTVVPDAVTEPSADARPTDAPAPPDDAPAPPDDAPRGRKSRRGKAAGETPTAPERPTDEAAPSAADDSAQTEDLPSPPAGAPEGPDAAEAAPRKTKLRKKRGAEPESNDE